jgi:hypothetical protein
MKLDEILLPGEDKFQVDGTEYTLDQLADEIAEQGMQVLNSVIGLLTKK